MFLDFLLSCISLFFSNLKSCLGYFVFRPPSPPAYRTQMKQVEEEIKEKVLMLKRGKKGVYESVEFSSIKHEYIRIPDGEGKFIPAILIKPVHSFNLCLIYSHGNSCDIGISFFECVDISLNTNCSVLLYEYPGYGLCKNKHLTENSIYYNIRKVYTYARETLHFSPDELVLYGHSLGTGPSVDLAIDEKYPVAAVILQAPFLSILRTVADLKTTPYFDYFANIDKISTLKTPILIIHGTKDTIVTMEDGEQLSKLVKDEHLYEFFKITDGDHNDIIKNHKSKVYKKLREFLNHVTKINFSLPSNNHSKHEEINSDFFRRLHPANQLLQDNEQEQLQENIQSDKNGNEDENFRNIIIKNYIETENKLQTPIVGPIEMKIFKEDMERDSRSINKELKDIRNEDIILEIVGNDNKVD